MTQDQQRTAEDLAAMITDGDVMAVGGVGAFPLRFMSALSARAVRNVTVSHPIRAYELPPGLDYVGEESTADILHISDFTRDVPVRQAIHAGRATYRPNNPHEAARTWSARYGRKVYGRKVYVCQASLPDADGNVSLGSFGGWSASFIEELDPELLLLELNVRQPWVAGDAVTIPLSRAAGYCVEDYELPQVSLSPTPSAADLVIAEHVAALVPDGATLQLGIGAIPDVVGRRLIEEGRSGLGLHTEMLSDVLVDLIDSGLVDNTNKAFLPGRTACTIAIGSSRVYDFLHENDRVVMLPIHQLNDPHIIASNPDVVAVNSTLMVDLQGQAASETIGGLHYSGTGGQWEFIYGANHSKGGRGILTVPSTARGGTISTIVNALPLGSAVTVPRNDSPTVITEYGAADLRGLTLRDRADALIAIAHPDFRDMLRAGLNT